MNKALHLKKIWLSNSRQGKLEDYYDVNISKDIIGEGTFAKVAKATTKQGNSKRAIKVLLKRRISDRYKFIAEVDIHRNLDHPNIVRLYETFEDSRNVYLVMELCKGREMFDRIIEKGHFTESEARNLFTQIIRAISYCHANGVCHRDIKPENFLFVDKAPNTHLKLTDFGLAKKFINSDSEDNSKITMTERCGTSYYIAPEVLSGSYDESCDIWSAGVVLYILLCGVPPFNGKTDDEIIDKVLSYEYSFKAHQWDNVSKAPKDLIRSMLCKAESRIKPEDILKHPWMIQEEEKINKPLNLNYESLKSFVNFSRFKKIAIAVIASQLSEEEISELSDRFNEIDKNGDGVLTFNEIEARIKELDGKVREEIIKALEKVDTDKSRKINYTEFIAATMEKNMYLKEDKLIEAFRLLDKDGNGKICADELKEIIGKDSSFDKSDYEQIIKEADMNGDGMIDYREFVEMMKVCLNYNPL